MAALGDMAHKTQPAVVWRPRFGVTASHIETRKIEDASEIACEWRTSKRALGRFAPSRGRYGSVEDRKSTNGKFHLKSRHRLFGSGRRPCTNQGCSIARKPRLRALRHCAVLRKSRAGFKAKRGNFGGSMRGAAAPHSKRRKRVS